MIIPIVGQIIIFLVGILVTTLVGLFVYLSAKTMQDEKMIYKNQNKDNL